MRRWGLGLLLLLSIGLNAGLLASWAWHRGADSERPADERPEGEPEEPEERERRERQRMPRFVERLADELELEGESRQAFLERQRRFFEDTLQARARFVRLQSELREELAAAEPDRRRIDGLLDEITGAHLALERAFVDNLLDTREILGPAQERRFRLFLHHLRHRGDPRHRFGREPGHGRPGPPRWPPRERPGPPPGR